MSGCGARNGRIPTRRASTERTGDTINGCGLDSLRKGQLVQDGGVLTGQYRLPHHTYGNRTQVRQFQGISSISRTLPIRIPGVNGFWRNAVPGSRTP
jgi:hypothetical protein